MKIPLVGLGIIWLTACSGGNDPASSRDDGPVGHQSTALLASPMLTRYLTMSDQSAGPAKLYVGPWGPSDIWANLTTASALSPIELDGFDMTGVGTTTWDHHFRGDMFHVSTDRHIYHDYSTDAGNSYGFDDWGVIPPGIESPTLVSFFGSVAATSAYAGRAEAYVLARSSSWGLSDRVYRRVVDNGVLTGWTYVGSAPTQSYAGTNERGLAAVASGSQVDVFVRIDLGFKRIFSSDYGATWGEESWFPPENLRPVGEPIGASWEPGRSDIFYYAFNSTDGAFVGHAYNDAGGVHFESLGTPCPNPTTQAPLFRGADATSAEAWSHARRLYIALTCSLGTGTNAVYLGQYTRNGSSAISWVGQTPPSEPTGFRKAWRGGLILWGNYFE